jgi:hypothetical protein
LGPVRPVGGAVKIPNVEDFCMFFILTKCEVCLGNGE